jgi:RecA-family ATPase
VDREGVKRALVKNAQIVETLRHGKNSEQLMDTMFPPMSWIIPGFVVPGLTILAGPPKIGKSFLAMGMACALANGGRVFGEIKVDTAGVLLLALEDTERRLKERLLKMWVRGSTLMDIRTQWPSGRDCLDYLDAWLNEFPQTKAIFIDTLQKVSGVEDSNSYRETYLAAAALKKVADKYSVAIVAIHHTSKSVQSDFVHAVNGSVGLTGAADTVITMRRVRMQEDGILSITGRDVEEKEYGIHFDAGLGTWTLLAEVPKEKDAWKPRKRRDAFDSKLASSGEKE